jgi:hypothetical protein
VAEQIAGNDIAVAAKMIGPEGGVSGTLSLSAMEGSLSDLRGEALLVELEAVKNDWTIHTVLESPLESSFTTWQLNLPEIKLSSMRVAPNSPNLTIDDTLLGSAAVDVKHETPKSILPVSSQTLILQGN